MNPDVRAFFDPATWTLTYIVKDPGTYQRQRPTEYQQQCRITG